MSGITDLDQLLARMEPVLDESEYVFITRPRGEYGDFKDLAPVASVTEKEGLTLVVPRPLAEDVGEAFETTYRMITLQVHSSLEAIGLTAAISNALAAESISANVIAGFYHDHIFVPVHQTEHAMSALRKLSKQHAKGADEP